MIKINDIRTLASRPVRTGNSVLTLYLNVDQSVPVNLNRGFEKKLKDMLVSTKNMIRNSEELKAFETASGRLKDFVAAYRPEARGLIAVLDVSDGFFWSDAADFPVTDLIRWNRKAFIRPIAVAIDEHERFGIVLLDRARLRLFTMFLGDIEEHLREGFDPRKVRHTKTIGTDHLGSASRAQRKADEQVRLNLRHALKDVRAVLEERGIERIILAGSSAITAELQGIMPQRLASRVIARLDIPITAAIEEIKAGAAPAAEKYERDTEEALVQDLLTSAAKTDRAVVGLGRTLHAVNQHRVWQLACADSFCAPGFECSKCEALFSIETATCSSCGSPVFPVGDVVEQAVDQALRKGARIEVVRGAEAESALINFGGIGAFLQTRTASVQEST
jgi:peptide subunit release factor 1 (eRF1)